MWLIWKIRDKYVPMKEETSVVQTNQVNCFGKRIKVNISTRKTF